MARENYRKLLVRLARQKGKVIVPDIEHRKFILNTSIFDAKLWHASPWKLKILIYLIANANTHTDQHFSIEIEKGQLLRSYRRIAIDCAYKIGYRTFTPSSSSNIKHFCDQLEEEGRISQFKTPYGILFTLSHPTSPESKPKPDSPAKPKKSLSAHHPFITETERTTLALLDTIEDYPSDLDTDIDFLHSLQADFPSLDLLENIKDWKTWLWDHRKNIKGQVRYRLRLRNWLKISQERKHGISSFKTKPKPSPAESKKFKDVYE